MAAAGGLSARVNASAFPTAGGLAATAAVALTGQ